MRSFGLAVVLFAVTTPSAGAQATAATPADIAFMQGMIGHHAQALQMAALVAERAVNRPLVLLAERLAVSQRDEIAIMQRWLVAHGASAPTGAAHHGMHDMPGMVSPVQMDSLTKARGAAFDALFLRSMIQHHEGALVMVARLLAAPAAARDPMVFQFASDVDTEQRAEIRRMRALLATLTPL